MTMNFKDGKQYYSLDTFLKNTFGEKIYKISLNAGMTCPNRDGKIGTGGCIFCSKGGSGEFASPCHLDIKTQIENGKKQTKAKANVKHYIAYFQAFTNTYASIEKLRTIFFEAINHPDIVALSIGTRPDCLPDEVLDLLDELNKIKPVFIELGFQTCHEKTAKFIRRGYKNDIFEKAVFDLNKRNINIVVHLIIGLPYENTKIESNNMIYETINYINKFPINGVKLSLLHILKYTDLADIYLKYNFKTYTLDEYVEIIINCLNLLRNDIVIHRLTGDGKKDLLIAPLWSLDKRNVLNTINHKLKIQKNNLF